MQIDADADLIFQLESAMKYILTILIVLGALTLAALNFHFIFLDDDPINFKVLKKVELTLDSTFVDARGVNRLKLILNPLLLQAGIQELFKEESLKKPKE